MYRHRKGGGNVCAYFGKGRSILKGLPYKWLDTASSWNWVISTLSSILTYWHHIKICVHVLYLHFVHVLDLLSVLLFLSQAKCCKYVLLCFPLFCFFYLPGIPAVTADLSLLTSYPSHPTHLCIFLYIYVYSHTYRKTAHFHWPKIRCELRSNTNSYMFIRIRHVGWLNCLVGDAAFENMCDRHMYRHTHSKNCTWPLLLNSQSSSHTHAAAGQSASWHRSI